VDVLGLLTIGGLNKWSEMYKNWKGDNTLEKPNAFLIKKEFNKIKESEFLWIYESPKDANQQAFTNLGSAFKKFFKKQTKYPKFKKKFQRDSFYVSNDQFKIVENQIKLPIIGIVKMTECLKFIGKIISCTISKTANRWFASVNVEMKDYKKHKKIKNEIIGIDLGLKTFAVCSNGEKFEAPKPLKKLKRKQRRLSNKIKGSNNRKKEVQKVAKLHYKIACIRKDFLHKLSTKICSENQTIILEDLKVSNMIKNHKLAKSISDAAWSEFRRQITYKSEIFDNNLIIVDTFAPTSKTCSNCGCKKHDLKLSDRIFKCNECNFEIDRDLNASLNLYTLGLREINACGHRTSTLDKKSKASKMAETRNNQCKIC
jgi:putative transposase